MTEHDLKRTIREAVQAGIIAALRDPRVREMLVEMQMGPDPSKVVVPADAAARLLEDLGIPRRRRSRE